MKKILSLVFICIHIHAMAADQEDKIVGRFWSQTASKADLDFVAAELSKGPDKRTSHPNLEYIHQEALLAKFMKKPGGRNLTLKERIPYFSHYDLSQIFDALTEIVADVRKPFSFRLSAVNALANVGLGVRSAELKTLDLMRKIIAAEKKNNWSNQNSTIRQFLTASDWFLHYYGLSFGKKLPLAEDFVSEIRSMREAGEFEVLSVYYEILEWMMSLNVTWDKSPRSLIEDEASLINKLAANHAHRKNLMAPLLRVILGKNLLVVTIEPENLDAEKCARFLAAKKEGMPFFWMETNVGARIIPIEEASSAD